MNQNEKQTKLNDTNTLDIGVRKLIDSNFSIQRDNYPKIDFVWVNYRDNRNKTRSIGTPYQALRDTANVPPESKCSSVKYWNMLLSKYENILQKKGNCEKENERNYNNQEDLLEICHFVLYGTMSHGEFFRYNLSQHLPEHFIPLEM